MASADGFPTLALPVRLCTIAQPEGGPDPGLEQFWSRQRAV